MHLVLGLPQCLKHEGLKIDGVCLFARSHRKQPDLEEGLVPQGIWEGHFLGTQASNFLAYHVSEHGI